VLQIPLAAPVAELLSQSGIDDQVGEAPPQNLDIADGGEKTGPPWYDGFGDAPDMEATTGNPALIASRML